MVRFVSLASSLVRRTIGVAILCAFLAALVQATLSVREERVAFDRAVKAIAATHVPLLATSLREKERDAVRRQLGLILDRPEIAYVRLAERSGIVFQAGDATRHNPGYANVLEIPDAGGKGSVATLELSPDPEVLYRHVVEKVLLLVGTYAILTVALCTLIAVVLRKELVRPMRDLARFTRELTPQNLIVPLELDRPHRPWKDEIDLVADGFRTLQDGIHGHVANLDAQVAMRTAQLQEALDEIKALTITDPLTGCFNRRHLDERLAEEVVRAGRSSRPLSLIVADLDHFKRINDTYGHPAGDVVLRRAVESFTRDLRAHVDWVARYGGEEFVVVLPDTAIEAALEIAERLRAALEAAAIQCDAGTLRITASFGVVERGSGDDAASLLARADVMLYRAKDRGRNRVVGDDYLSASSPSSSSPSTRST